MSKIDVYDGPAEGFYVPETFLGYMGNIKRFGEGIISLLNATSSSKLMGIDLALFMPDCPKEFHLVYHFSDESVTLLYRSFLRENPDEGPEVKVEAFGRKRNLKIVERKIHGRVDKFQTLKHDLETRKEKAEKTNTSLEMQLSKLKRGEF